MTTTIETVRQFIIDSDPQNLTNGGECYNLVDLTNNLKSHGIDIETINPDHRLFSFVWGTIAGYGIDAEECKVTTDEAYQLLLDCGVSAEALDLVVGINGNNIETYEDILFCRFGERDFSEL